jgi:hypothetical protein
LSGVAPAYGACEPALALQPLTMRVLDSGRYSLGSLTKRDTRLLSGHLARAAKALAEGDVTTTASSVEQFPDAVQAIQAEGRMARPLAAAYVGWAGRLITLLTN